MKIYTRAFTLIELMVVISIIAILATVSVPTLSIIANSKRLESTGRIVQSALNEARRLSITKRRHHKVVFTASGLKVYDMKTRKYVGEKLVIDKRVSYKLGFRRYTPPFNDSGEDEEFPAREAIDNYSIEFRNDGSAIFDPHSSVSRSLYQEEGNDLADLVFEQEMEKKKCYVDIDPASGRAIYKVETPEH